MSVLDVNVSANRLDLRELRAGDCDTEISATNKEKVHTAPILYIDTVFEHCMRSQHQYRLADYACSSRRDGKCVDG